MNAPNGGIAARRAIIRWAARLFRREWRQQVLVLALLTFAVAAAILGATAAYNLTSSRAGEFGSADFRMRIFRAQPPELEARVAAVRQQLGTIDVIGHRSTAVPGSVESVDVRAQDPHGPYGAPMLALRSGRLPNGPAEVAVTDKAATLYSVHVGSTFALDGRDRTVVGVVENPGDLRDEFVLVDPRNADPPQSITILMRASAAQATTAAGVGRPDSLSVASDTPIATELLAAGASVKTAAAALTLGLASVVLLLVALVAAAGFVVIAQRRLRQLGMIGAVGATDRQLRLVVVANGLVVGAIAAVAGAVIAVLGWLALAPMLETAAGHRIARFDIPWWLVAAGMTLAVVTAAAAAWWPARVMAQVPITQALSARPPRPHLARRSLLAAVALIAIGIVLLSAGVDMRHDTANVFLVVPGTIAISLGVLFMSPLAVRALASVAGRLPVAMRLALRDLGRHQARSGAALAAISLGVGIAVATVVIATAAQHSAGEGNLSDRQLLFFAGKSGSEPVVPRQSVEAIAAIRAELDRFASTVRGVGVIELDAAVDPTASDMFRIMDGQPATSDTDRPAVILGKRVKTIANPDGTSGATYRDVGRLYVATPALLAYVGLDSRAIRPDTEVLTSQPGDLRYINVSKEESRGPLAPKTQSIAAGGYSSAPRSLITAEGLRRHGWEPAPAAWLVQASARLTDAQLTAARQTAVAAGLVVESRKGQPGLATTRSGATAAGVLLALGILAMTVGLIRGEAAADLRTLTAAGATSTLRRTLTATTAGALALLGAVLGIAGAYLALVAGYLDKLEHLSSVPLLHLSAIAIGLPLAAAVAGWLLSGREPLTVARQPLLE